MAILSGHALEPAGNARVGATLDSGVFSEVRSALSRLAGATITYTDAGGTRRTALLPAELTATVWGAGSLSTFDRPGQTWVSFFLPTAPGVLYLTPESTLASVAAGTDIVPLDLVLRHRIRAYQPRPLATLLGRRTYVFAQTTTGKGLSLWTGTFSGGSNTVFPPAGWETIGFDDSAWGPVYDEATGTTGSAAVATGGIWTSYPAAAGFLERILTRSHVVLPAGAVLGATLAFVAHDLTTGIYVNGTFVPFSDQSGPGPWFADMVTLSPTLLAGGTDVLIAASYQNAYAVGGGGDPAVGGFFALRVEMDSPGATPLSYADAVLADLPLAYWPLDEASGTSIHDTSGNGHTGTATGTIAYGVAGPQAGSTALGFAGAESILVPASGAFPPIGATAFTLEAWAAPDPAHAATGGVLCYGTRVAGTNSLNALILEGPLPPGVAHLATRVRSNWFGSVLNDPADHILVHAWHHVAVTYDGTTLTLYRDSVAVATSTPTAPAFVSTDVLIGVANVAAGEYFYGALASVALYDHALSAARILAHYNAG